MKGIIKGVGDYAAAHAFFLNPQLWYWELADIQVEINIFIVTGSSFKSLEHMLLYNFSGQQNRKPCQNYGIDIG